MNSTNISESLCPYVEHLPCNSTGKISGLDIYRSVHGYVAASICSLGILGQIATIVVLVKTMTVRTPVNFLLVAISVSQMLHLATYLPMAIYFYILKHVEEKHQLFSYEHSSAVYLEISYTMAVFFHSLAVWLTVAVATYRWIALGIRNSDTYCNITTVRIGCAVLCIFNMCMTIPLWMSYEVYCMEQIDCSNSTVILWTVGGKRNAEIHIWIYGLLGKSIPAILLTLLTIPLINFLRNHVKNRKKKLNKNGNSSDDRKKNVDQQRTTGMLLAVVVLFLCIELPQGIFIIVMRDKEHLMKFYNDVGEILDIVTILAFSINFILYTIMSKAFRTVFEQTFCGSLKRSTRFVQLTTAFTSLKQTGSHKRSISSNLSAADAQNKNNARNGRNNFLHPSTQPLLTESTHSTSCYSTNGVQETELN